MTIDRITLDPMHEVVTRRLEHTQLGPPLDAAGCRDALQLREPGTRSRETITPLGTVEHPRPAQRRVTLGIPRTDQHAQRDREKLIEAADELGPCRTRRQAQRERVLVG